MPASLRARAADGDRLLGVLLRMPSEELVEMAAIAGFDFVLVDCEHGPADVAALRQHIAVAAVHDVPVLVRIGQDEHALVLRALDQGAEGIVAPHIDDSTGASALVGACHYPPLGHRGFATYGRAGRFGQTDAAAHRDRLAQDTLVIGMIESPLAVRDCGDILATAGLDGIMVGPADLAAASGPDDPPLPDALAQVHAAVREAGKFRMDIVAGAGQAEAAFDDGAQLVVYNLTHTLMAHLRSLLTTRR